MCPRASSSRRQSSMGFQKRVYPSCVWFPAPKCSYLVSVNLDVCSSFVIPTKDVYACCVLVMLRKHGGQHRRDENIRLQPFPHTREIMRSFSSAPPSHWQHAPIPQSRKSALRNTTWLASPAAGVLASRSLPFDTVLDHHHICLFHFLPRFGNTNSHCASDMLSRAMR